MTAPEGFSIKLASNIEASAATKWLVEGLWAEAGVGVIGGEPKCGKSFMALDLAFAVASGKPCLRRFKVGERGPVLLFSAEDGPSAVRARLDGIAAASGSSVDGLPIHVIEEPFLLLDDEEHRVKLTRALESIRPRLLMLDPYVRLQRSDENQSGSVAPILGFLRSLNRTFHVAIVVVHHAKKSSGKMRAGQALRGSGDFHAWGDSNLYLRRIEKRIVLSAEHRAAEAPDDMTLELSKAGGGLALRLTGESPPEEQRTGSARERIEVVLAAAKAPLTVREIRALCRVRTVKVCRVLSELTGEGVVERSQKGYALRRDRAAASQNGHGGGVAEGNGNGKPESVPRSPAPTPAEMEVEGGVEG